MAACRTLLLVLLVLSAPITGVRAQGARDKPEIVQAERAYAHGEHGRALSLLEKPARKRTPRALTMRGRIYLAQGKREQAEAQLYEVIALYNDGKVKEQDGASLWAVAEAAALLGAFRNANEAFALASRASPKSADIRVAWAELLYDKHDLAAAERNVQGVLSIEEHAGALELLARIELSRGLPFSQVESLLARALRKNPDLASAHVTRAGMLLRDELYTQADAELGRALAINPRDLHALSMRAAIRFAQRDLAGFANAIEVVLRENPRYSRVYSVVATYAEWQHRYPELVELADAALRVDPDDAEAWATRGMNLLRTGREQEGREALKEARHRDAYNLLVLNVLNLYEDVIDHQYQTIEAPPFVVRVHRRERDTLVPYLLPLLTRAYEGMAGRYGVRPKGPLHVELFASERDFSVRTSGLPHLGIQGVCFGNTLTAVSPEGAELNWGQIVWHELSHVFHVALAQGRVPRWFTEGLAEYETERARPEWRREDDRLLWDTLQRGKLPPLAELNVAFTHAQTAEEITAAYYASTRLVAYLVKHYGDAAIARMLRSYGEGNGTEQVFAEELGSSLGAIDQAFRAAELARLRTKYVDDFRADVESYRNLDLLAARASDLHANEADRAAWALGLATVGDAGEAKRAALKVLAQSPQEPIALFALAHLALKAGDLPAAIEALLRMIKTGHDGYQLRMLVARALAKSGDVPGALTHVDAAAQRDPERHEAYELMASMAQQLGDHARLRTALERWTTIDQHAREPLLLLLSSLEQSGDWQLLLQRAQSALFLVPASSAVHRAYALALAHSGRPKEAHEELSRARQLAKNPHELRKVNDSELRLLAAQPGPREKPQRQAKRAISR